MVPFRQGASALGDAERTGFSESRQRAVLAELDLLLKSPAFRTSKTHDQSGPGFQVCSRGQSAFRSARRPG